jgi:DNA-binding NarL/FixJ family response regulator
MTAPLAQGRPTSVFVVEDDTPIRDFLCQTIELAPGLELAGKAHKLSVARDWLSDRGRPLDVLLVDLSLPDGSGLELIAQCQVLRPDCDVMVLSIFGDSQNVFSALQAGASGYLLKSSDASLIVEHIQSLRAGGSPLSPAVARLVLSRLHAATPPKPPKGVQDPGIARSQLLSAREVEVLQLITFGKSYAEIGSKLFISTHTVNAHIRQIYRKLQVKSRGEATHIAARDGLISMSRS